jgi:PAS domain S-box-containing protein
MFESFLELPLHFAIEFLGFLLTAGGAGLVLLRPQLVPGHVSSRLSAVLGFACLAAVQVLHGSSFVPADAADATAALTTLGYALLLVGVAGGLRPARAGAFLGVERSLLLAPAAAAALLAAVAGVGSMRPESKPLRRLAAATALLAVAALLTAQAEGQTVGSASVSAALYAAHAVRLGGYLALAMWLWTGVKTSIGARFVASFVILLVVVVLALAASLTAVITRNIERDEFARVAGQATSAARAIEQVQTRDLADDIAQLASTQTVTEQVAARNEQALVSFAQQALDSPIFDGIDLLAFTTPRRKLLGFAGTGPAVRTSSGAIRRLELRKIDVITIAGSPVVRDVASGRVSQAAGPDRIDARRAGSAGILVAVEVRDPVRNRAAGIVVGGRFLDALTIEAISNNVAPARASLIVGDEVVASDLPGSELSGLLPAEVRRALRAGEPVTARVTVAGRGYFTAYRSISGEGGVPVATLAISSPARVVASARAGVTRALFLVAMAVAVVALGLAWYSGRRITRPIQALTATVSTVREGDLQAHVDVVADDEVGQLGETFNEMTASLRRMTDDLRAAAREEQQLRGRIETIIESMADGLIAVDSGGKILAFNRAAERLTGHAPDMVIGEPIDKVLNLVDGDDQPMRAPVAELAEGSLSGVFVRSRSGERVPVALTCAVLRDEDGEVTGAVAVMRDMTQEREIERMKSQFLSNISHELRTPLTPIKGYAEILGRRDVPPERMHQFAKGILESTARLERIVELLVDFSALEAGRLSPRARPVDLGVLLTTLAADWRRRSPSHRIETVVDASLPRVLGDERLLRRSLEELVDNAVKFSPDGGTVTLGARRTSVLRGEALRPAVEVSVADEGIGIPAEDLPRIFSDFQQLDGSETRSYGGLGLGLSFAQRIVEAHDGEIEVSSEPDHGTTVTITLPAQDGSGGD